MREFGLIGYPLEHSFSKKYFTQKFEKENLADVFFELFPLESIQVLPQLISEHPNLRGLAVTIPFKQSVMPFLDEISEEAAVIGAINCIRISQQKLTGYNTDAAGFEKSFLPLLQPMHTRALVLGNGGAAMAVQFVLRKNNIPFHTVSRHPGQTDFVYEDINKNILQSHSIIINCTPLGMEPHIETKPDLPYEDISENHLLYDLVYNPCETLFLKLGKQQGALLKNGYDMLQFQAEENWRIWNTD